MSRPRIEDLIAVKLCEPWPYALDESSVTEALELGDEAAVCGALGWSVRGMRDGLSYGGEQHRLRTWAAALVPLRRSLIFCIDSDLLRAVVSDGAKSGVGLPPLPPLPARWIAIQAADNGGLHSVEESATALNMRTVVVLQLICEIDQGRLWRSWSYGYARDEERMLPVISGGMEITPVRSRVIAGRQAGLAMEHAVDIPDSTRTAVEAAQLITARGVSVSALQPVDRAERRRLAKRHPGQLPTLYWVDVRDRTVPEDVVKTDRRYSCRWLVRGHWRNLSDDKRTWVKAYVKGPPGAPWRGRPVYSVAA